MTVTCYVIGNWQPSASSLLFFLILKLKTKSSYSVLILHLTFCHCLLYMCCVYYFITNFMFLYHACKMARQITLYAIRSSIKKNLSLPYLAKTFKGNNFRYNSPCFKNSRPYYVTYH